MIAIVNYGMGNLASVKKALTFLNIPCEITNDPNVLDEATHILLPGVGSFKKAMQNLNDCKLIPSLKHQVQTQKKPFLGICLGMQLLAEKGFEDGETEGLGLIEGDVVLFPESDMPATHIGWNNINILDQPLFKDIKDNNFYFVHSYYFKTKRNEDIAATVEYNTTLTAAVHNSNIFGVQFHPEKSQKEGLKILKNFYEYA